MSELSHPQWPQQGQEAGPGIAMGVDPGRAANPKGWSSQDNNMDTQGPGKGMGVYLGTATGPIGKSGKDTKGARKHMGVDMGSSKGKHRNGKGGGRMTDDQRQRQAQLKRCNFPWGHIPKHKSPKELRGMTDGMIVKWKALAMESWALHTKWAGQTWTAWPTAKDFDQGRKHMEQLLQRFGIDRWRCIRKFESDETFPDMKLWPDGKCWADFHGDTQPDMPMVIPYQTCDLYLTDYDPHFWKQWFPPPDDGKGVCPGHGSEWLSWHGTHPYGVFTALAGNFLMRSESEPGDSSDAKVFGAKYKFETAAGRGIYTSQSFHKALQYGIPLFWNDVGVRAKLVLLTMLPGDSQHELGTLFKIARGKAKGPLWQKNQTISRWQIIPTKQFEPEVLGQLELEKVNKETLSKGTFRYLRQSGKEFRPKSLVELVDAQQFDSFTDLQCRAHRKVMQQRAHAGHSGEGSWTITDPTANEVLSSMVHIVGFVVLYHGKANSKNLTCPSRSQCVMSEFDMDSMPNWARPRTDAGESGIGRDR